MTLRRWAPILVWALAVAGLAMCVAASFLACSPTWNAPLPVTPEPGLPCGETGTVCPGAMCCAEEEVCGKAGTSCPEGTCCFVGPAPIP